MRLRFSPQSMTQLAAIRAHIGKESANAAELVRLRILAAVERLLVLPHLGRTGAVQGTRELRTSGLPFIIVYRVDAAELIILGIFHARQNR